LALWRISRSIAPRPCWKYFQPSRDYDSVILGATTITDLAEAGDAQIRGETAVLERFVGLLDTFDLWFNIVTP
jgi:alkyl sulfatase BDS1-like metallo-beta-lactamase superfamily hydrolase